MPLRKSSGNDPSDASPATLPLAAAAAPAAAATTAGHPGVHHGVRREGRGARRYGGEVGDHTPRFCRAALRTLRGLVRVAHRAHQVEAILAACALVLVEGHLYPTSRFTDSRHTYCTALRAPRGDPSCPPTTGLRSEERSQILCGVKVQLTLPNEGRNRWTVMVSCPYIRKPVPAFQG